MEKGKKALISHFKCLTDKGYQQSQRIPDNNKNTSLSAKTITKTFNMHKDLQITIFLNRFYANNLHNRKVKKTIKAHNQAL